jgi:hypothetical protein
MNLPKRNPSKAVLFAIVKEIIGMLNKTRNMLPFYDKMNLYSQIK